EKNPVERLATVFLRVAGMLIGPPLQDDVPATIGLSQQKRRGARLQLPIALEAISISKNHSARNSLPIETQNPEEKFIGNRNARLSAAPGETIEEHWLDLPDGRMRYLKAGSGPALILVHGLMGYSFSWRFTMPALAPHATIYAIDNLGAGFSTAKEGMDCTARATAERVLKFADAVGIKDFDLLGTSHGGGVAIMVAAICAERHDTRLQRLILVAPVNPWSPHGKRLAPFLGSAFGSMLFLSAFERWPALHDLGLRRLFGEGSKIPRDSLEGYRIPARENHALRHAGRIV